MRLPSRLRPRLQPTAAPGISPQCESRRAFQFTVEMCGLPTAVLALAVYLPYTDVALLTRSIADCPGGSAARRRTAVARKWQLRCPGACSSVSPIMLSWCRLALVEKAIPFRPCLRVYDIGGDDLRKTASPSSPRIEAHENAQHDVL